VARRDVNKRLDEFLSGFARTRRKQAATSKGRGGGGSGGWHRERGSPGVKGSLLDFIAAEREDAGEKRGGDGGRPRTPEVMLSVSAPRVGGGRGNGGASPLLAAPPRLAPRAGEAWWSLPVEEHYVSSVVGYLLDVKYSGRLGRAVALIYDEASGRLAKWVDRTGHRPYFLVGADPETLSQREVDFSKHQSFVQYQIVSKFHPIERRRIRVTKVVVADPLAVRELRQKAESKGFKVWEADIKYHLNYIYDKLLVPGMRYAVARGFEPYEWPSDVSDVVEANFADEPEDVKARIAEWIRIFEAEPPDPPMIAFDIEVFSPSTTHLPDPDKAYYPVISVAYAASDGRRGVMLLAREGAEFLGDTGLPEDAEVEVFDSERAMLLELLRRMENYVVIVTFNGDNFDVPYLYNRLIALGVDPELLPFEIHQSHVSFTFALHVDLFKLFDIKALQTYAFGNKYREKSLDAIANALLGEAKHELKKHVSEVSLDELAFYNYKDAELTLRLLRDNNRLVWNLIVLIMRISKLGLEDMTRTNISLWIKGLLYWEHRKRGWLIPSRKELEALGGGEARVKAVIKDKKYKGAIVLEPPQGIFFNVVVVDFASLYPSIIKMWNLSYETVNNPNCRGEKIVVPEAGHEVCMEFKGISSEIVGLLRDFRVKIYKKKAKDKSLPEHERLWYDTVQAAMKVYINASYGVFGTESFALYSLPVAESVTALGRTVLKSTVGKARELDLFIIYGDTDSLFLWDPPMDRVEQLIDYVKREFGLDLEIDKVFRIALFSGLKKNYIGVTPDGDVVIKGMVAKKSNTPEFIKKEFSGAVKILLKLEAPDQVRDILEELRGHVVRVYNNVKRKRYTLDEFAIRVMLSKDPREYTKNTPQHVKAALLLEKEGLRLGKGDYVAYVKTKDSLGVRPVALAKLGEVDSSKYLEYVKTAFEQMLLAFGVKWEQLTGVKRIDLFADAS